MIPPAGPHDRPKPKQDEMLAHLRRQIITGRLKPGQQLPTRLELVRQYQASSRTLQPVLKRLIDDRFLRADRRNGTFVVDHPPHRCHYGIVFPSSPAVSGFSRHWQALVAAARGFEDPPTRRISTYYGMDRPAESAEYETLLHDVLSERVAGLLFVASPWNLRGTPVTDQEGIPRVAILAEPMPGVDTAWLAYDGESFARKAVTYLHERGRTRIGLVVHSGHGAGAATGLCQPVRALLPDYGMTIQDHWIQGAAIGAADMTANCISLLIRQPLHERPDGLIIGDDHLVEDVTAGLLAAGVRVPEDLDVVAYTNFPCAPPAAAPVWRLGHDMSEVMTVALTYMDKVRCGVRARKTLVIEAKSEEEVENSPCLPY